MGLPGLRAFKKPIASLSLILPICSRRIIISSGSNFLRNKDVVRIKWDKMLNRWKNASVLNKRYSSLSKNYKNSIYSYYVPWMCRAVIKRGGFGVQQSQFNASWATWWLRALLCTHLYTVQQEWRGLFYSKFCHWDKSDVWENLTMPRSVV